MAPKLDPAIIKALSLEASGTTLSAHGGSGFAFTGKVTSVVDGKEKLFFVKTGKGNESEIMFAGTVSLFLPSNCPTNSSNLPLWKQHWGREVKHVIDTDTRTGEHQSLNAIHTAVLTLCPRSYAHGALSTGTGAFLVTDFLDLTSSSSTKGSGQSLAQKLATLHSTPAPIPSGYSEPQFGFLVPTCCGNTQQDNTFKSSWADFYAENRLRGILTSAQKNNGADKDLERFVNQTVDNVVPRLLGDEHLKDGKTGEKIKPVVVHGDLWSGNHGRGTIWDGGVEEVVFDPSSAWAHSEFDFGIMRMFGGFVGNFEKEYRELKPKDERAVEFEDRVALYEL
jgi:protein-ribulosamine 3-kinase